MTPCELCKGACCESIVIPLKFEEADAQRWLGFHGTEQENGIRLDCKCSKLRHGRCTIYDSRPDVCRVFEVGSPNCREAVKTRRQYKADKIFKLMEAGYGEEAKG